MLQAGDKAPDFDVMTDEGKQIKLKDFKGKYVILYFYPKDDTPGCTKEACAFRDDHSQVSDAGAVVIGVSPDDPQSHDKFAKKYHLPFPLLADTDHALAEKYGVWVEKNNYGKKYWGIARTTFLIDPEGKI